MSVNIQFSFSPLRRISTLCSGEGGPGRILAEIGRLLRFRYDIPVAL